MEIFTSEVFDCNDSKTTVIVDNQNHGGIVELLVVREDVHGDGTERAQLGIEIDFSQIDKLIEALQTAKKLSMMEYVFEYSGSERIYVKSEYEGNEFENTVSTFADAQKVKALKIRDGAQNVKTMLTVNGITEEI